MKKTAILSNKLLILSLILLAIITAYLVITLAAQHQPLSPPWRDLASVGWVSEMVLL